MKCAIRIGESLCYDWYHGCRAVEDVEAGCFGVTTRGRSFPGGLFRAWRRGIWAYIGYLLVSSGFLCFFLVTRTAHHYSVSIRRLTKPKSPSLPSSQASSRYEYLNLIPTTSNMLTKALALAAISTAILAEDFFSPNHLNFGAMMKRQGGYYPTTHPCGQGDTCAEACGPTEITCPSAPGTGLYCYDPTIGDHCCADGSGSTFDT